MWKPLAKKSMWPYVKTISQETNKAYQEEVINILAM